MVLHVSILSFLNNTHISSFSLSHAHTDTLTSIYVYIYINIYIYEKGLHKSYSVRPQMLFATAVNNPSIYIYIW